MKTALVDIDGTLADCRHRLHYILPGGPRDWDSFFAEIPDDTPIVAVCDVVRALIKSVKVVLCSGRPEKYRNTTEAWLDDNGIPRDALYMRPDGDTRPDYIVKAQILRGIIEDGYEPFVVIDDRQTVVDMWRDQGIVCLQAAPSVERPPDTAKLTLMVGPAGSGKSSWLATFGANNHGIRYDMIVSSDWTRHDLFGDFRYQGSNDRVYAALHAVVKCRLRSGLPTVVDATNIKRADRVSLATILDVPVTYIVLNRSLAEKRRDGGWRNEIDGGAYDLIGKHEQTFNSNLKDILRGDDLRNVTVLDYRQQQQPMEMAA